MKDQDKTKKQLIAELADLRRQLAKESASPEIRTAAALLQVASLGIHECDTEGRIRFVNPSQAAITGFSAEELVGTYVWDRIPPGPERDALPAYFKQLVSEQPSPTPYFAKNFGKNGELFDARVDWNYIRDSAGQVTGFVSIVSDITESKQAEQTLRKARDFSQGLIASMLDGFSVLDTNGVHVQVNDALCRMTGFSWDELIGVGVPHPYWPPEHCEHIQGTVDRRPPPFWPPSQSSSRRIGELGVELNSSGAFSSAPLREST
jgi:PAS domain S-box-containing protein